MMWFWFATRRKSDLGIKVPESSVHSRGLELLGKVMGKHSKCELSIKIKQKQ